MFKRFCCLLLSFLLILSFAAADAPVTIVPYFATAEEYAYAKLLGLDKPHLVYHFAADAPGYIRLNIYMLQDSAWQLANTQSIPYSDAAGRFALECEALEKQLRIALQCGQQSKELICHPLFSQVVSGLTDVQVSLSEAAEISFDQEIPLVLQVSGSTELTLADYNRPSTISGTAYAITITFEKEETP